MTGRELAAWILENHAEDMEILYLREDGTVTGAVCPEKGRSIIL